LIEENGIVELGVILWYKRAVRQKTDRSKSEIYFSISRAYYQLFEISQKWNHQAIRWL